MKDFAIGLGGILLQASTVATAPEFQLVAELVSKAGVIGVVIYGYIELKKRYEKSEEKREKEIEKYQQSLKDLQESSKAENERLAQTIEQQQQKIIEILIDKN